MRDNIKDKVTNVVFFRKKENVLYHNWGKCHHAFKLQQSFNISKVIMEKGISLKERKLGLYNKVHLFSLLTQQSPDIIRPLTKDKANWYNPFDKMEMGVI